MIHRINRFISVLLVVGLSLYIVGLNRDTVTVRLLPGTQYTGNTGVVLIVVFVLGIISAALVGIVFGIKGYFRERRFEHREKIRKVFYAGLLEARGYLAAGEWQKARDTWERLVKKDPTDIIARVELSRSLEGAGEPREALKVLDAARAVDPTNSEVLFRAAELNVALGNKTAAIDNLALILYHCPNERAARRARDLSEELGRIDDALQYHGELRKLALADDSEAVMRLEFKQILKEYPDDQVNLERRLRDFVKTYPAYVPALLRLAEIERKAGNGERAVHLLVQAARRSGFSKYWGEAVKIWLDANHPDRALGVTRTATKETTGLPRINAELEQIRLYLSLNMLDDALQGIDNFTGLVKEQNVEVSNEVAQNLLVLKGLCLNRLGKYRESANVWKKLSEYDFEIREPTQALSSTPALPYEGGSRNDGPSPRLSTP